MSQQLTTKQKINEKTRILYELGLYKKDKVKSALNQIVAQYPNNDVDTLLNQRARTMIISYYEGDTTYC